MADNPNCHIIEKCHEGSHRQRRRDDDGRTQIAEEEEQQNDNERDRLDQGLLDRADRLLDQIRAVIEHVNIDAGGQAPV